MALSPMNRPGKQTYHFGVRVNWDKLIAIDQQNETFKAQVFVEATLMYPPDVRLGHEEDVKEFFKRATVENSLAKPEDDGVPKKDDKRWKFCWLIHGEFGEKLELEKFPFDTQDLAVMLRFGWPCHKRKDVQVRFVDINKSKVFLQIFCLQNAWSQPKAIEVDFGFTKIPKDWKPSPEEPELPDQFPLIEIRCQVQRKAKFYLVNVVLPVASIVLASISSLAVWDDMGGRLGATLTLLLTAVAYKYLVAEMVPKISYSTLLDWYVLVCWAFLLVMVLVNCFVHHLESKSAFGWTFGLLFAFFNIVFTIVCWKTNYAEHQRLDISKNQGQLQVNSTSEEQLCWASTSDEENQELVTEDSENHKLDTRDPQGFTLTLDQVFLSASALKFAQHSMVEDKNFEREVEQNLQKYAGKEPNAMKYVKCLVEWSTYLARRGADSDWHLNLLEELRLLLSDWIVELSDIATDVETLMKVMRSSSDGSEHVRAKFPQLRQSLLRLQSSLESVESEKQAVEDASNRISEAMKYIPENPPETAEEQEVIPKALHKAQMLLESCVETVLIGRLGGFKFPVAKRLGELWKFPSDHLPVGAALTLGKHHIKVASWNVLNRHFYKYIDKDTQGLKGSEITTYHEAGTRELKIIERIQELLVRGFHILCLQECSPELLEQLKEALGGSKHFEMECSGEAEDKNQEAIVYDAKLLKKLDIFLHAPHKEAPKKVVTEVLFQVAADPTLRVVTTHLPGAPFGPARAEFANCVASIVNGQKLPTVLLADLNFPEKAVHPFLTDRGLEEVYFVPVSYPTNICQGSLLPKRIDSIAVINHEVESVKLEAAALEADEIMEGLGTTVELLTSRSVDLASASF